MNKLNQKLKEELLEQSNSLPCYVLSISKKELRLFQSDGKELSELRNSDFPLKYEEEYEYSRPDKATSYSSNIVKEFEPDKSVVAETRLKQLLRKGDTLLAKYLANDVSLIITGESKELADYLQVSRFKKKIIGKIPGNYTHNGKQDFEKIITKEIQNCAAHNLDKKIQDLQELVGRKLVVCEIEDVWESILKGNCRNLYIEKDYHNSAYIGNSGNPALQKLMNANNYRSSEEAVEDLIQKVLEKNGNVILTENGRLDHFKGIALELRYPKQA